MKIAISNIAWGEEEEEEAASLMENMGIKGVEITPGRIFKDKFSVTMQEVSSYKKFWSKKGISIISMQALLYGKPQLTIFDSKETREETMAYLKNMIDLSSRLESKILVFGSPKNRNRGNKSLKEAHEIAVPFFRELGDHAARKGIKFCIENNPPEYGSNYIETALQALELVEMVNSPGFGLHIDSGGLILSNDPPRTLIECKDKISHFHISKPFLEPLNREDIDIHKGFSRALKEICYAGWASIEMKQLKPGNNNINKIREILEIVTEAYSS
jgi:D-psicose/D-tagatose/L-ribulose 3-epimerase